MNDEICDFYMQVANELCDGREWCVAGISEPLRRFAELVAAAEREACAAICVGVSDAKQAAQAIRARGGE
jgi:hypothetical protein